RVTGSSVGLSPTSMRRVSQSFPITWRNEQRLRLCWPSTEIIRRLHRFHRFYQNKSFRSAYSSECLAKPALLLFRRRLLPRHLAACFSGLGQADCDRLFLTRHFLTGTTF